MKTSTDLDKLLRQGTMRTGLNGVVFNSLTFFFRYYTGRNGNIQLCMVLDGHHGESAAEFAVMNLAGKILSESHIEDPKELLERVFHKTEDSFFLGMDDPIGRRLALKSELSVSGERGTIVRGLCYTVCMCVCVCDIH